MQNKETSEWAMIESPNELFRYGIEMDFKELNQKPLKYNTKYTG